MRFKETTSSFLTGIAEGTLPGEGLHRGRPDLLPRREPTGRPVQPRDLGSWRRRFAPGRGRKLFVGAPCSLSSNACVGTARRFKLAAGMAGLRSPLLDHLLELRCRQGGLALVDRVWADVPWARRVRLPEGRDTRDVLQLFGGAEAYAGLLRDADYGAALGPTSPPTNLRRETIVNLLGHSPLPQRPKNRRQSRSKVPNCFRRLPPRFAGLSSSATSKRLSSPFGSFIPTRSTRRTRLHTSGSRVPRSAAASPGCSRFWPAYPGHRGGEHQRSCPLPCAGRRGRTRRDAAV